MSTTPDNQQPERPPVLDWSTDFDHTDAVWSADPYPIWDELRGRCPLAHSDRYGGTWLPTTHHLVSAIAYDTENFTSRSVVVGERRPTPEDLPAPIGLAPPITSDPPFHHLARRLLLPAFSPKKIEELTPFTTQLCNDLIDQLAGRESIDAAVDYAQHIPVQVIAKMLGFPLEDADYFRHVIHLILEAGVTADPQGEGRQLEADTLDAYFDAQIADHVKHPRDDLTTYLLNAELDGNKLQHEHVRGTMILLLVAGIDTTWSAIGAALWHLAQSPDDRTRLTTDPQVWPFAIEEFLRAYAPVTMARMVAQDCEYAGQHLTTDDWVLLPFPSANRDPEVFDRADEFVIDRAENRHLAFGLGIHRCIGSNLARMELTVALEEWMRRIGDFSLSETEQPTWSTGQVRGPRTLPVIVPGGVRAG
jgi:cytochrome P450